jgi:hypothetical protein
MPHAPVQDRSRSDTCSTRKCPLQYEVNAKDGLIVWSIAAHVSQPLVGDSHQVRDFVLDDMSESGD